jgi:hypothetical protein
MQQRPDLAMVDLRCCSILRISDHQNGGGRCFLCGAAAAPPRPRVALLQVREASAVPRDAHVRPALPDVATTDLRIEEVFYVPYILISTVPVRIGTGPRTDCVDRKTSASMPGCQNAPILAKRCYISKFSSYFWKLVRVV